MKQTKTQIKRLIKSVGHLSPAGRKKWLVLAETADPNTLQEIGKYFEESYKEEADFKLKLIYKHNLGEKFKEKTEKITKKFISNSSKKEVIHQLDQI